VGLHVVAGSYAARKHLKVTGWLAADPCITCWGDHVLPAVVHDYHQPLPAPDAAVAQLPGG
jgi:hypothetical protein